MKIKMKKMKNVKPGVWVRLVLLIASLVNMALTLSGKNPIGDGSTVSDIVSIAAASGVSLVSYWKNNSFTEAAIIGDEIMEEIKSIKAKEK